MFEKVNPSHPDKITKGELIDILTNRKFKQVYVKYWEMD